MLPAFFIMLREGVEAALIVGIVAGYLHRIGRGDQLGRIWLGTVLAVGLSVSVGLAVALTVGQLPEVVQGSAQGLAGLVAVAVLTWMLFWMRSQSRRMKGDLEHDVQMALTGGSVLALAGLAFVSVLREGLETVLYLVAVFSESAPGPASAIGALAGLAAAVAIGVLIFYGGHRINLGQFFTITGAILIPVAAGLCVFAVHEIGNGGLIANGAPIWDLGGFLPESSPLGSLLAGVFGYRAAPSALEVGAYLVYLIPVASTFLFLATRRPGSPSAAPRPAPPSGTEANG